MKRILRFGIVAALALGVGGCNDFVGLAEDVAGGAVIVVEDAAAVAASVVVLAACAVAGCDGISFGEYGVAVDPGSPSTSTIEHVAPDGTRTPLVAVDHLAAAGASGDTVYFVAGDADGTYRVMAVPSSGGAPRTLATGLAHVPSQLRVN